MNTTMYPPLTSFLLQKYCLWTFPVTNPCLNGNAFSDSLPYLMLFSLFWTSELKHFIHPYLYAKNRMFLSHQNSDVEIVILNVMELECGAFDKSDSARRADPYWVGLSALMKKSPVLLPSEETVDGSMNHEGGSHQTQNLPTPSFWTSQTPEL